MLIKRKSLDKINNLFQKLANQCFDVKLQYKLIKIKKAIQEENAIYQEQVYKNCEPYFEKTPNGQPVINENGGFKIREDCINECNKVLLELDKMDVQVPDIYLSLDELNDLNLTFSELEVLEPFIQ